MVTLNKKAKKIIFIVIPIIAILIIATIMIGGKNKKRESANSQNGNQVPQQQVNVYLASEDNTLVPLTIKYNVKETLGENLMTVLGLIKENSGITNATFRGLVPEVAKVNQLTLNENKVLAIDFDAGLFEYQQNDEIALLQSLTWTMTEFDEVDAISLSVDGEALTKMPRRNTPVNETLTRDMGINHFVVTSTFDILGSTRILSFYNKTINHQKYLIPVTQYVENKDKLSVYDLAISKLFEKPSITTRLTIATCFEGIALESASTLDDHVLHVSLNEKALYDEETIQTDIYNLIMASMSVYEEVENVGFIINEEMVPVNGIQPDESFSVGSIIYNEYYI